MLKLIHLSMLVALTSCVRNYTGWNVYRVSPAEDQEEIMQSLFVKFGYDFWKKTHGAPMIVNVNPSVESDFFEFLNKNNITHAVHIWNLGKFLEGLESPYTTRILHDRYVGANMFDSYLSHAEMNVYLKKLARKYPSLITVQTFGKSYEGRSLDMVKISDASTDFKKPIILIDAGIHAREWITPAMALYIINQLAENATNRYLTEHIEWYITPLLNPDGYEYSHSQDIMWRKTRSATSSKKCYGVDANRNFDFHWMESGSSELPCADIYAGKAAFSEKETQALRNYILALKNRIKLYLTFHSFGPMILYPYAYQKVLPRNAEELETLARKANEAHMAAGGESFDIGSAANMLYEAAGGSDDWAMGHAEVPLVYTIELPSIGDHGFHPPPTEIQKLVTPVFEAVRVFAHHVTGSLAMPPIGTRNTSQCAKKLGNILLTTSFAVIIYLF